MAQQLVQGFVRLRYQHHNIHRGDEVFLSIISNHSGGSTCGVFQYAHNQGFLKLIGTLDKYSLETINEIARPQAHPGVRVHAQRGGARVGSMLMPDCASVRVSNNSDEITGFPQNYGRHPPTIILNIPCRR